MLFGVILSGVEGSRGSMLEVMLRGSSTSLGMTFQNGFAYGHTRTYRYPLGRERIPGFRSRLELPHDSGIHRQRSFLDEVPRPMGRFRTTGRKCDSDLVLVLEHRRKPADVRILHFSTRSCWHSRLSSEFVDLHP